jgi:hypothetical protein
MVEQVSSAKLLQNFFTEKNICENIKTRKTILRREKADLQYLERTKSGKLKRISETQSFIIR